MKIATVVGARPQFIKAAVLNRKLIAHKGRSEVLIHTGQHYHANMSEVFFTEMGIPKPDYHFDIHSLERLEMLDSMQSAVENALKSEMPDLVLVYGDTNSTLAGARAAKALNLPLAHVEAGLRSYNEEMPEELNRVETDLLSDYLFVPAQAAVDNLRREGIAGERIHMVGDIMYDAHLYYSAQALKDFGKVKDVTGEPFALLTLHRKENLSDPVIFKRLFDTIDLLAEDHRILLPLHPGTKKRMQELGILTRAETIDPVGYFDMIRLLHHCKLVLTDSGGVQKEAYYSSKFCITLREETEWTELVAVGANEVCGSDPNRILSAFQRFEGLSFESNEKPYGIGDTAERILKILDN